MTEEQKAKLSELMQRGIGEGVYTQATGRFVDVDDSRHVCAVGLIYSVLYDPDDKIKDWGNVWFEIGEAVGFDLLSEHLPAEAYVGFPDEVGIESTYDFERSNWVVGPTPIGTLIVRLNDKLGWSFNQIEEFLQKWGY